MMNSLIACVLTWTLLAPVGQAEDATAPAVADTAVGGPVIFVEQANLDLGVVREGETATATFVVENRGTEDLVINKVQPSCGCTTVQLTEEEKRVKPGEKRNITISFNSKGRVGPQHKSVRLDLNDPKSPVFNLMFTADVQTLFRVLPRPLVNMRTARRGADLEPLTLMPTKVGGVFELVSVEMPPGFLEYEAKPTEDPEGRKGIQLDLRVPDDMELGTVNNQVTIHGQVGEDKASVVVRVAGQVVGDLEVRPLTLQSLGATPRGRRFAPVTVASTNDQAFNLISAEAGPYIRVETEPRKDGREYSIRTTLAEDAPDGPLASTLVIRTDNPAQPVVGIPIFVDVKPRVVVEPAVILLGSGEKDHSRVLRLQNGDNAPFTITEVYNGTPALHYELDCKRSDVPSVRFARVGLEGDPPAEPMQTQIVLKTDIRGAEEISVPVIYTP